MKFKLKGISKLGKNRVREHGDMWTVKLRMAHVSCLNGQAGILLEALDGYNRWMAVKHDKDFLIVPE